MEPHHRGGLYDARVNSGQPVVPLPDDGQHSADPEGDTGMARGEAARGETVGLPRPVRGRTRISGCLRARYGPAIIIVPIAVIISGASQMSRLTTHTASAGVLALLFVPAPPGGRIIRYARKNLNARPGLSGTYLGDRQRRDEGWTVLAGGSTWTRVLRPARFLAMTSS
jgi:hypothetical protein